MPVEPDHSTRQKEPHGRIAGAIQRANDCLRLAVEGVSSVTDAPLRLDLIRQTGDHQVFEVREEFELGRMGRSFVVSVDPHGDRVVVIAAGRPA